MKFKYRCFIENTEDSVKWLESIGYTRSLLCPKNDVIDCDILFTSIEEKTYYVTSIFSPVTTKYVDCRGNSPLFKAVSAMREDSDFGQLFECKGGLFICQYETSREHIDKECKGWNITNLKKLNLEKLQERFKLK